jgi:hypothetical protein
MKKFFLLMLTTLSLFSCKVKTNIETNGAIDDCEKLRVKSEIEGVLKQTMECNYKKDINCFMQSFDSLFVLESPEATTKSRTITKDSLQKDIQRDWSIIAKIYEVERWIDSIHVSSPDSAIVYTDQFYHRTFLKPNGQPGEDDVVTTQKHREKWIRRNSGWKQQRIRELGGAVYVNGKPYNPE